MTTLILNGVVFQDFEIPESINFGGDHRLAVHKLAGGKRQVDAMGPDDADIHWSGRFRGGSAEQRALFLDFMRRQGSKQLLTWGLHVYQVVISKFEADFHQTYEIPYSITCVVVQDLVQKIASAVAGFAESMAGDLVQATGLSSVIGKDTISTAVTGVGAALSNFQAGVPLSTNAIAGGSALAAPLLSDATGSSLLTTLKTSISSAQTAVGSAISSAEAGISSIGSRLLGGVAGAAPTALASNLTTQASTFGQLSNLYPLSSTLGRMATNTTNAGK